MIKIVKAANSTEKELINTMRARANAVGANIKADAAKIMADICQRGMKAVEEYSLKFDKALPYEIFQADLDEAYKACPADLVRIMEQAAANIWDYQKHLLAETSEWQGPHGGTVGQLVQPLNKVGIYVPGGTAAYPSSVLMNAIPARVAGVKEIIMVTPPTENLNLAVLAAAKIAKVDRVIALGGVQAIAALTYGVGFIPKVDKIVGPGNAYVAAAKNLAYGTIDIDIIAGPSEVLVIADETANPVYLAADLLSQAEHDTLASSILLTTSLLQAQKVAEEIEKQTTKLARKEIIKKSVENFGAIIVCPNLTKAAEIANEIAPEHLEIMTEKPREILKLIKNAGAVFLGENTPEPLGDYMAGPSHVLPTSGTARFFSPLSAESFLKRTSIIDFDKKNLARLGQDIITFAQAEGLDAHANSIRVRLKN